MTFFATSYSPNEYDKPYVFVVVGHCERERFKCHEKPPKQSWSTKSSTHVGSTVAKPDVSTFF